MRPLIAALLMVAAVSIVQAERDSSDAELRIAPRAFSRDGVLTLEVSFHSATEITVYSWRGQLYPLLGYGLTVAASGEHGESLTVESVDQMRPKLPHPLDAATAREYEYPKPLVLLVSDEHGKPFQGCAELYLTYDVPPDPGGRYSAAGLDLLSVRSNEIRTCSERK